MAERTRTRRNTLERRCLGKSFKRMFIGAPKGVFKMLEKIKRADKEKIKRGGKPAENAPAEAAAEA
jgi:hypothetical protein